MLRLCGNTQTYTKMNTWIVTKKTDPRGYEYGEQLLVGTATAEPTYEVLRLNGCTDPETPMDNAEKIVRLLNASEAGLVEKLTRLLNSIARSPDVKKHVDKYDANKWCDADLRDIGLCAEELRADLAILNGGAVK